MKQSKKSFHAHNLQVEAFKIRLEVSNVVINILDRFRFFMY